MGDYKGPERVDPSSLVQGAEKSFSRMRSASDISMAEATAPAFHHRIMDAIKAQGKVRGDGTSIPEREAAAGVVLPPRKAYVVGARVLHSETGRKLTIIHAKAGYTKNTHRPVHRVADKDGNTWLIPESKLILR